MKWLSQMLDNCVLYLKSKASVTILFIIIEAGKSSILYNIDKNFISNILISQLTLKTVQNLLIGLIIYRFEIV